MSLKTLARIRHAVQDEGEDMTTILMRICGLNRDIVGMRFRSVIMKARPMSLKTLARIRHAVHDPAMHHTC